MTRFRNATADTFRSLRHKNFRIFFVTQGISFTGTWVQLVAQTLLILRLTDSGTALGLLTAIQFAPTLVLGAWAGVVIDRHDKRRLMAITTTAMLLAALALGLLVLADRATVPLVYLLAAVLGLANTFDNPARRTLVNDLVPAAEVSNAVSLNSTLVTSARIVGPALAGLLVVTVGIGWCFVVNAASFVAALVGLWLLDASALRSRPPVARAKGQLRAGLRYVSSIDDLRIPLLLMAVVGTLSFNFQVLLPLLAKRDLGGTDGTYTLLTTVFSVGSLVGSLRMARRQVIDTRFLGLSAVVLGITTGALAFAPNVVVAGAILLVTGYAGIGVLSGGNAVLQMAASPEMRGRVLALFTVVFLGSTPIGGPIAGWAAEEFGTGAGLLIGAVAAVAAGLAVLAFLRNRDALVNSSTSRPPDVVAAA
ncbi:MAG: MFS transporter [Actinomycetota bacterium]|nr:MFS transporter [Actinomycetota bacterium]